MDNLAEELFNLMNEGFLIFESIWMDQTVYVVSKTYTPKNKAMSIKLDSNISKHAMGSGMMFENIYCSSMFKFDTWDEAFAFAIKHKSPD